jgi:hypothetical protein
VNSKKIGVSVSFIRYQYKRLRRGWPSQIDLVRALMLCESIDEANTEMTRKSGSHGGSGTVGDASGSSQDNVVNSHQLAAFLVAIKVSVRTQIFFSLRSY